MEDKKETKKNSGVSHSVVMDEDDLKKFKHLKLTPVEDDGKGVEESEEQDEEGEQEGQEEIPIEEFEDDDDDFREELNGMKDGEELEEKREEPIKKGGFERWL